MSMSNMKITIFLIALVAIGIMAFKYPKVNFSIDEAGGIQFHKGSFKEALAKAKSENKLVFLDIYATWCGPCKKLKSTTFSNKEVGDLFNNEFINIALDGEQEEGAALAQLYKIKGYPTLLFLNANGEIVKGASGYHSANELIELGKSIK